MGGNALKNIETRRYQKYEYFELFKEIHLLYNNSLIHNAFAFVLLPSYENKETFGDMDILINTEYIKKDLKRIKEIFKPNEVYNNGNVISFDYKQLQIDFIFMRDEYFNSSLNYYSYNDLGNLMGRVANNLGTKYGHAGLIKKLYSEDRTKILDEVHISNDTEKIFDFLGFDYSKYKEGFIELEDIFNYVISSQFFSKELFAYENLDHQNRTRNRKRKTYQSFLDYIENNEIKNNFSYEGNRSFALSRIDFYFPEVMIYKRIELAKEREKIKERIKEKFNGSIVSNLTKLEGSELGKFIQLFKASKESFDEYILNTNFENIKDDIILLYKTEINK